METSSICHIIVMPANLMEKDLTFFQGFSREISVDYPRILSGLSLVPHDILDLCLNYESYIKSKMYGSSLNIRHLNENILDDNHLDFDNCFTFIWSTENTFVKSVEACKKFKYKPIHISCKRDLSVIFIDDVNEVIVDEVNKLRERVAKSHPNRDFSAFISEKIGFKNNEIDFPFPPLNHNCTTPMVKTLMSCGYSVDDVEYVTPSQDIEQHINGMISLSKLIDSIRSKNHELSRLNKADAIIFCASSYSFLYDMKRMFWKKLFRNITKEKRSFIRLALVRNKGFGNFTMETDSNDFDPYNDEVMTPLLSDRIYELNLFKEIISIISVSQFCPAFRFPNAVMLHHDRLSNIASLIKSPANSKNTNTRKLNKAVRRYTEAIVEDVGENLFDASFKDRKKILAVCDFPIEWLNFEGFPLMFTHEVSRIFPTPGNLFGQLALNSMRVIIPYSEITNILVVRSFRPDDPIKNYLSKSLDAYGEQGCYENLNIKVVDVASEIELIDVLNEYDGFITVFDCHGDHGGIDGLAWLQIGDEKFDVWTLANKCQISPIIILSACSTHPIDGSHASVAHGFLRCGAVSILGTYAPVNAIHSGQFVARILNCIAQFVPSMVENEPISWREIISGLLRMSYVTDVLMGMKDNLYLINEGQYEEIHVQVSCYINEAKDNWQFNFINTIVDLTELDQKEVRNIIRDHFQFVETMLYSQLGNPENLLISKSPE